MRSLSYYFWAHNRLTFENDDFIDKLFVHLKWQDKTKWSRN